eukprot:gene29830-46896_t
MLIGVSRLAQLGPVMAAARKGPLPPHVVAAFDDAHRCVDMKS